MKSGPAIIILHGWGLSAKRFSPLARTLGKLGLRIFVPDLPGFGDSKMPSRPFTLSDYVSFLEGYIQKRNLTNVVLLGHSFGGRVALKYAVGRRRHLLALILTGTPGFTPVPRRRFMVFIIFAKIGKFIFSVWPLNLIQERIRAWYYYLVGAREFYRAQGVMRETFKLIVREELVDYMRQVLVPCFLVWGALDQITPVWIAEKMHKEMPSSELIIIPGRGHGVPFQDPDLFVSHIKSFLRKL